MTNAGKRAYQGGIGAGELSGGLRTIRSASKRHGWRGVSSPAEVDLQALWRPKENLEHRRACRCPVRAPPWRRAPGFRRSIPGSRFGYEQPAERCGAPF